MAEWRIYYAPGIVPGDRVTGQTRADWQAAPADGLQAAVLMAPCPDGRRPWAGVDDRQIWTGADSYDPFGWGAKRGRLIGDARYARIWRRACRET